MDIFTIFQTLLRWGIPALAGGIAVILALACTYKIYKKAVGGKTSLTKVQIVCAGLLCCWLILVLCLTSISRGANFTGSFNVEFLSGYRSAWNNWSITELQLILFNILMFTPLGFLLPLLWKKAETFWVTCAVSLGLTALIETIQLLGGTGIFELDDLFHNLLGSLFGYFCIMAILTSIREKRLRIAPIAKMLMLPFVIGLALGVTFYVYDRQPYGNMSILPAIKQDVSSIQIVAEWEPSDQEASAAIYKNRFAEDKAYVETIRTNLAKLEELTLSQNTRREDENLGYLGTNANGTFCRILFFFRTGEWSYTTYAETAAQLTEETVQELCRRYETWMKELELLPETAEFSVQNGDTLRWDARPEQNLSTSAESFQNGSVMIQFDESGALSNFFYQLTWNDYVTTEKILSESQAYAQVLDGNFEQYLPFQPGDILHVTGCELTYLYDTKGFYQPVYQFSGYINDPENVWLCQIPALSK